MEETAIDIEEWDWVCDKNQMICRNIENCVVVKIETIGKTYNGKLHGIPLELFGKIARLKHSEQIIQKIIKSAEDKFFLGLMDIALD